KKFQQEWLTMPEFKDWLVQDKVNAKCKICNSVLKPGKSDLIKHSNGLNHLRKMESIQNIQPLRNTNFTSMIKKVQDLEAAICAFIVENDLPIVIVERFVPFLKSLPDIETVKNVSLGKQKATNLIRQGLRSHFNALLIRDLNKFPYSLFIDETTDISTEKQLAIMVSYFDKSEFTYKTNLLDIIPCPDGSAKGIFSVFKQTLLATKINLTNWIGFCSDTTNTMMGEHHSVSQMIKSEFPEIHIIKCNCHLIHLCADYACRKLPNSLEDICRTIYNHFARSPKNVDAYKKFQKFYNIKPHKLLKPCQTRWLSIHDCVRRIIEQWDGLKAYWETLAQEDPTVANNYTFAILNNPSKRCLLYFVEYGLDIMTEFNTIFQNKSPNFFLMKTKVIEIYHVLASNFMKREY
ncbi:Transposon-derived Buster3 transposase-like protein, partial [Camponotus floridanus]